MYAEDSYLNCAYFLLGFKLFPPYFPGKSFPARTMYFELLQLRLITHVQGRLQRGELTERGLARRTGISQPHLHNVLKGVRGLSPQMGDLLLRHLHITLIDLLNTDELTRRSLEDGGSWPADTRFPGANRIR